MIKYPHDRHFCPKAPNSAVCDADHVYTVICLILWIWSRLVNSLCNTDQPINYMVTLKHVLFKHCIKKTIPEYKYYGTVGMMCHGKKDTFYLSYYQSFTLRKMPVRWTLDLYDSCIFTQHPMTSYPHYLFLNVSQQSINNISMDKICGSYNPLLFTFCVK